GAACSSDLWNKTAAGADLAATRSPHRPGTARAPGLRAGLPAAASTSGGSHADGPPVVVLDRRRLPVELCRPRPRAPAQLRAAAAKGGGVYRVPAGPPPDLDPRKGRAAGGRPPGRPGRGGRAGPDLPPRRDGLPRGLPLPGRAP